MPAATSTTKAYRPDMAQYEARLQSFKAVASSSKARKTAAESAKWPHPLPTSSSSMSAKRSAYPTPAQLSSLGFFFSPTTEEPDRVESYIDGIALSGFEAGDSAEEKLESVQDDNAWLAIFNSRRSAKESEEKKGTFLFSDELLPTGQSMIEARKRTFAELWPYDGKKGFKCTSQKLAQAGFHYEPTPGNEDTASCIYCGRTLSGWEKGDDAVHEHIRKKPECPFFNCEIGPVSTKEESKTVEKKTTKKTKQPAAAKGKRGQKAAETETEDEGDANPAPEEPVIEPPKTRRAARHQRTASTLETTDNDEADAATEASSMKTRATRSTKAEPSNARNVSRKGKAPQSSGESEPETEVSAKPSAKAASRTRGRAAKGKATQPDEEPTSAAPTDDDDVAEPPRRATRAKSTRTATSSTRKTRAATASATASEVESDAGEDEPAAEGTIVVKDVTEVPSDVETAEEDRTAQAAETSAKNTGEKLPDSAEAKEVKAAENEKSGTRSRVPSARAASNTRKPSASSTRSTRGRLAVEGPEAAEEVAESPMQPSADEEKREIEPVPSAAKATRKTSDSAASKKSGARKNEPISTEDSTMHVVDEAAPEATQPTSETRSSTQAQLGLGQAASAPGATETGRVFSPLPSRAKRNVSSRAVSRSSPAKTSTSTSASDPPAASSPPGESSPPIPAATPVATSSPSLPPPPSPQAPFPASSALSPLSNLSNLFPASGSNNDSVSSSSSFDVNLSVQSFLQAQIDIAVAEMNEKGLNRIEEVRKEMDMVRGRCEEVMRGKKGENLVGVGAVAVGAGEKENVGA